MPVGALPPNSLVAGGSDLVRFQRTVEREMPVLRCLGKKVGEGLPRPGLRKFLRYTAIPALRASVASSAERRRRIPLVRALPTRPYERLHPVLRMIDLKCAGPGDCFAFGIKWTSQKLHPMTGRNGTYVEHQQVFIDVRGLPRRGGCPSFLVRLVMVVAPHLRS